LISVKETAAEELSIVGEASAAKKSAVDAEKGESTETAVAEKVRTVVYLIFYLVIQTLTTAFFLIFFYVVFFLNTFYRYHQ
jgi:hypothetical protein